MRLSSGHRTAPIGCFVTSHLSLALLIMEASDLPEDFGPVLPANYSAPSRARTSTKWPHFRELTTTTGIQLDNPLSANSKKCSFHKLFIVNRLQKAEKLVTFSMTVSLPFLYVSVALSVRTAETEIRTLYREHASGAKSNKPLGLEGSF